jgi:AcrR family transcriptional regulator
VRPTVDEQLRGVRAVLERVVAPDVRAPYPTDVLATVLAALERLEHDWSTVPAALRAESADLDALLAGTRAGVSPETATAIDAALAGPTPDWLDPAAARAHYLIRRGLLADVVRETGAGPAIVAHLRTHVAGPL